MYQITNNINFILIAKRCVEFEILQHLMKGLLTKLLEIDYNTHTKDHKQKNYINQVSKYNVIQLKIYDNNVVFQIKHTFSYQNNVDNVRNITCNCAGMLSYKSCSLYSLDTLITLDQIRVVVYNLCT